MATEPRSRPRRNLLAVLLYVVTLVLAVEAGARLILVADPIFDRVALRSSVGWRLAWQRRHSSDRPIYYAFDQYHPTRGWASRPGVQAADTFGPTSVNTNSIGLRGSREVSLVKSPARPRVLILGDSFTFGDEVRDEQAYPAVLDDLLPEAEVLNFGVHGYGHDQMLLMLREEALRYQPDLVVLGFVRDDMERNMLEFRDFAKPKFELAGDRLSLRNVPVPTPERVRSRSRWRSRLIDLLAIIRDNYRWKVGLSKRRMNSLTSALLDEMVEDSVAAGAVFVFAYLPHSEELTSHELETPGYLFFEEYCSERAAFCVDLLPEFRERITAGTPINTAGHWHARGHRVAAEALSEYIHQRDLLNL